MSDRWDLNEEDLWEEEPPEDVVASQADPSGGLLVGQDPEKVLAVYMTEEGEVRSVKLADAWKSRVDPRNLASQVVSAANAATIEAAAAQAELAQSSGGQASGNGTRVPDDSPITSAEALQLVERATADLEAFQRQVLAVAETVVSAQSGGGHVQGTAKRGQVLGIEIDVRWCSAARNSEVEGELLDVLKDLRCKSSSTELASGPQSQAIAQLYSWASDPQRLLRRLGLSA
ncbi:hypothetical protein [Saccharopolyspora mangrovi]|uniref:YbaB/EbfC family DNA-binding protein n=1 Tax=Saccharopolyspora mangrovi TaxID=3082379 RepID=A0ABU6A845_9PSEU|nr:hypothetical protein [Saccharopolyspora sp. S2-29]MEB3367545.1 hypothetical protein [Saccharopolyspora sp. S2-29]